MARSYDMAVLVEKLRPDRVGAIRQAVNELWHLECAIEAWSNPAPGVLEANGRCYLEANDSPADFASRLAEGIWTANQGYCEVGIVVLLPGRSVDRSITYRATRDDYQTWSRTGELPYIRGAPGIGRPLPRPA